MPQTFPKTNWALILGGSSGFGLASAAKLASHGMNLIIFHRDRRGAMGRIKEDFAALRNEGIEVLTFNADALSSEVRDEKLNEIAEHLGDDRIHLLLHSIAFGNLKLSVAEKPADDSSISALAERLGIEVEKLQTAADEVFSGGADRLQLLATPPKYSATLFLEEEDLARTIHAMGTSLLGWVQAIHGRGLFAADSRVLGLTSEGNTIAWKGYAAVAAAKVALESVARSIAVEFAPHGIRCNVLQPGVAETPALRLIPGNAHLKAEARSKNPFGRLTQPEDVADMVYLMAQPEAAWVNGALIRVDGGEHVSGVRQ